MEKRMLLHICCAPCLLYPLKVLQEEGWHITGFWYNPNIHPYTEYRNRLNALKEYAHRIGLEVIYQDHYDLEGFLRQVVFRENHRCPVCYFMRMARTALEARERGYAYFSTTLLVSPYQQHDIIRDIGYNLEKEYGINFCYRDFREGYREGVELSRQLELYRQKYCGCIYSERDRYLKTKK